MNEFWTIKCKFVYTDGAISCGAAVPSVLTVGRFIYYKCPWVP